MIEACRRIVGEPHAGSAGASDTVDGLRARAVAVPGSIDEARDLLRLARERGWRVVPRGGGSKLGWGGVPSGLDLVLGTARLGRLVEHAAGDLVATAEAGLPLHELQRALAGAGQRLALDPPQAGATVGGTVAANAAGPLRLRFGSMRDLLIGVTVVLADGTVARSGGKVVKNVAGYDLGKLFTGSLGTLGLVVQATFRLHPLPQARRTVQVEVGRPEDAGSVVQALLHSALVPSAIELAWPSEPGPGAVAVLFEGTEAGVDAQVRAASSLAKDHGTAAVRDEPGAARLWQDFAPKPVEPGGLRLKVGFLPAVLPAVIRTVFEVGRREGLSPRLSGHVACGILFVDLPGGETAALARAVEALRERAVAGEGSVVVLEATPALKRAVDVWGDAGEAVSLMRRVKERFDPGGTLSPGRFVGGL